MSFIRAWEEYMFELWQKCEKQCEKHRDSPEKFRKCMEKCEEEKSFGTEE